MAKGKIYLLPSPISSNPSLDYIPRKIIDIIAKTDIFWVENLRTTRRYFSNLGIREIDKLTFRELNKHTDLKQIENLVEYVNTGKNAAILSEAGCPGIADPGSKAVQLAHRNGIQVIPIPGPSSIFLALMASGFNGQNFIFHGYLPIEKIERKKSIRKIQQSAIRNDQTQIFMETPYRNNQLVKSLINVLNPDIRLCIASDLTGENEFIKSMTVKDWSVKVPDLHKRPTIFLLYSY